MSSSRSEESPGHQSSTSEPSKLGIMEERSEPQLTPTESSVQRVLVLRLHNLLSIIFGHLAADSDLDAIKNVRLVCSLWKQEAFFALKGNLSLMPYITVENPNVPSGHLLPVECLRSLEISSKSLMPGCGLPLQLVVNEWTPELESFIRDFSKGIVSFGICGSENGQFYGFPEDMGGIELPLLKRVLFADPNISNNEGKLVEFAKAMTFRNNLVKASKNLETCEVNLGIPFSRPVAPDNAALQQVVWSQVGILTCSYEFFVEVNTVNELSALQDLGLSSSENNEEGDNRVKRISLKKVPNLSWLSYNHDGKQRQDNRVEWILDHQMKELKYLKLDGTTICGRQPPSRLLPNLEEVFSNEVDREARSLASLISGGGVFGKTVKLVLNESWLDLNGRIGDMAVQICESFPNLTELNWHSHNDDLDIDVDINNALFAAPVIFSMLEFLTTLKLGLFFPSEHSGRDMVELLTGTSLENIPEDENSWPTALEGNTRSICNLRNLRKFHIATVMAYVDVGPRLTRFLFHAAFRTMDTLEELHFEKFILGDRSCVTEWEEMGRQITVSELPEILRLNRHI